MKLFQLISISSSIIEISIFSSIYEGRNNIPLFFTLYLKIVILEKYIKAYLISIIEFLYFRGENSKIHWRWSYKRCLLRFSPPLLPSLLFFSTWVPATSPMELNNQLTLFIWRNLRCRRASTNTLSGTSPHSGPSQNLLNCSTLTTVRFMDSLLGLLPKKPTRS